MRWLLIPQFQHVLLGTEGTLLTHVNVAASDAGCKATLAHAGLPRLGLFAVCTRDVFAFVQLAVIQAFKARRKTGNFVLTTADP